MAGSSTGFSSKLDAALYFAARGFHIFPLQNNSKHPRSLAQFGSWKELATTDPALVLSWWSAWPEANIGCHPGASGCVVIDVDDKEDRGGSVSLILLEAEGEPLPPTLTCVTPTGGRHLWYRLDGAPNSAGSLGPGLDTKGRAGFVVMPGSTIDGAAYELADAAEPAEAPAWLAERIRALRKPAEERKRTDGVEELDLPADVDRAKAYLLDLVRAGDVAIEGSGGNDRTYRLGGALRDLGVSSETAAGLVGQFWNPACVPPWEDDELHLILRHAYKYAQNEAGVKALGDNDGSAFAAIALPEPSAMPPSKSSGRFPILAEGQQDAMPEPSWLIPSWLAHEQVGLLYGAPGTYKSFVALHFALSVAAGIAVPGVKYPQSGSHAPLPTLYVAGEGAAGVARKRRPAWKQYHEIDGELPFFLAPAPPLARDAASAVEFMASIEQAMAGCLPRLIVYDTYSRLMAGLDENDAGDTGRAVEMISGLCRRYACAALIVHHANKSGQERGSSALRGAVDSVYVLDVNKTLKTLSLYCDKQKDAEEPKAVHFAVEKANGSLVLKPCAPETGSRAPSQLAVDVSRALHEAGAVGIARALSVASLAESLLSLWGETIADPAAHKEARRRIENTLRAAAKKRELSGYVLPHSSPPLFSLPADNFTGEVR